MLNFGSANVGGGSSTNYWDELINPTINIQTIQNINADGVVTRSNNAPAGLEILTNNSYEISNTSGHLETAIYDSINNVLKVYAAGRHDTSINYADYQIFARGVIQGGTYVNNEYESAFIANDTRCYYYLLDTTRNVGIGAIIQNDINGGSTFGWSVQSPLASGYLFGIDETGKICTNQIDPDHTHTTPIGSIPIHDTDGVYQGKLLLY